MARGATSAGSCKTNLKVSRGGWGGVGVVKSGQVGCITVVQYGVVVGKAVWLRREGGYWSPGGGTMGRQEHGFTRVQTKR